MPYQNAKGHKLSYWDYRQCGINPEKGAAVNKKSWAKMTPSPLAFRRLKAKISIFYPPFREKFSTELVLKSNFVRRLLISFCWLRVWELHFDSFGSVDKHCLVYLKYIYIYWVSRNVFPGG